MKKFVRLSLLLALSIALNLVETLLPFNDYIPGLKLGLANIVNLFIIYKFTLKDALYVGILRVFLVGILRTGLFSTTFFFSLAGVLLSIIFMYIFKKMKFSIIGVSVIGSIMHSLGQVIIAIILLTSSFIYYLPYLLIISIPSGIITGMICKYLVKYYEEIIE